MPIPQSDLIEDRTLDGGVGLVPRESPPKDRQPPEGEAASRSAYREQDRSGRRLPSGIRAEQGRVEESDEGLEEEKTHPDRSDHDHQPPDRELPAELSHGSALRDEVSGR